MVPAGAITLQLPTSIRDFVCPADHNTEFYTCLSEKLTNSSKSAREDPNEYVRCDVSTVSFLVIFAKSLLERVDRQCGRLLNLMNLWIVAPVAQLDRVADFENSSKSSLCHKHR